MLEQPGVEAEVIDRIPKDSDRQNIQQNPQKMNNCKMSFQHRCNSTVSQNKPDPARGIFC